MRPEKIMPNGEVIAINRPMVASDTEEVRASWWQQWLLDLNIFAMPHSQTKPPGFYVNFTTIAALTVIIGFIAGGFWWTWQRGQESGIAIGEQRAINQQLQKQISDAAEAAAKAKDIALGAHSDQQEFEKEKKKK